MRRPLLVLVIGAFLALTAAPAQAEDPVIADLRIDSPAVVTVGDRVGYTIVVEVDAGAGIALAAGGLPEAVTLVAPPRETRVPLDNGRDEVSISFQLAPFVPGEIALPPFTLRYNNPDGTTGTVDAFSSVIEVTSVLPAAGQVTPAGLKPQAEIGQAPPTWPWRALAALLTVLVLLIIAAVVRRRFVKYRITRALRRQPVLTSPEDIARADLDDAGAAFAANGDYVVYYTALGNAIRNYLTQRFEFPAFALTTRELEADMLRLGLDRWQIRVASGLLSQCDAVVYARYRPAAERADADLTAAYEIVEISRPQAASEEREEVPVS